MTGDWRAALFARRTIGVRLGTASMEAVLDRLAPGLRAEPPFAVVHIVGTNGKGSTAAMVDQGLRTLGGAGESGGVGLFTSPHLERIGERIRLDGAAIADEEVHAGLAAVAAAEAKVGVSLSFFEVLTAIALLRFVAAGCRAVVLEAGLGGRLDATAALAPRVVGITRIGLDHQAYLGDTLAAIAAEKAAVMRRGVPAFSVAQSPEARATIERIAADKGAPLEFVAPLPRSPRHMQGPHQAENAALALALLQVLEPRASAAILDETRWPGRLERIRPVAGGPVAGGGGAGELWLDVAHNEDGVVALVTALDALDLHPTLIVFGTMADKAGPAMAARLRAVAPLWLVPPASEGAYDLDALAGPNSPDEPRYLGPRDPALVEALERVLGQGGCVLVCGSHYLVGGLRAQLRGGGDHDGPELSDPVTRTATQTRS